MECSIFPQNYFNQWSYMFP